MAGTRDDLMKSLDALVGVWRSSGETAAVEDRPPVRITGTDSYEWLPGGNFMIHRADVVVGDEKVDVIEMIGGYDEERRACAMHAFQGDGGQGLMWAGLTGDGGLLFADDATRATLTGVGTDTMEARWERLDGDRWVHWMDMRFTR